MKAKIIQTGEIVTILAISTEHMTIQCYGNDGIVRLISLSMGDIEIIPDSEKTIDWEQRRYEIAKEAMNGILSNQTQCDFASSEAHYEENVIHTIPKTISQYAVACADALIEELKKIK